MQLGIAKESDVIFRFSCFCKLHSFPSPPHTFGPHNRKGKFSGYFPSVKSSLAPGSSTHCHTAGEASFSIGKGRKESLPHIKVKMKELRCFFLNKIHYQATILLQNPLMKMRQRKWFLYFSVFILHQSNL